MPSEAREVESGHDFPVNLRCLRFESVFQPYGDSVAKGIVTIHQTSEVRDTNPRHVKQRPGGGGREGRIAALSGYT